MACLRSSEASRIASPKRAFSRCTSSLSSGTGFGGASFGGAGGAAGFGGAAAAGAPGAARVPGVAGAVVVAGGFAAGGAIGGLAAVGAAGVAETGGLVAAGSAGASGTADASGLEGIEDFSAVPSGGFAAGPFSEGSLTIGSIGCPRPLRATSRVRNRLAARLFNTLQKTTSIPLSRNFRRGGSQTRPLRLTSPARFTPSPARPCDTTTHTRSAKFPKTPTSSPNRTRPTART